MDFLFGDFNEMSMPTKELVDPFSVATVVEPYQVHKLDWSTTEVHVRRTSIEGAFESAGIFLPRSVQIAKMFIEAQGGGAWTVKNDEDYIALNTSDSIFSLCMRLTPDERGHEIGICDHAGEHLKVLGHLPRHSYNSQKVYDNILGSLSEDRDFAVVLIQSTNYKSLTVCVFDVVNATCLLTKKCSEVGFLGPELYSVAINPRAMSQGQYRFAVLNKLKNTNSQMVVRIWDPVTLHERYLPLKRFWKIPGHRYPRPSGSSLKFSPDVRFLCVLGDIWYDRNLHSACLLMDSVHLEPLYVVEYGVNHWWRPMCNVFPTFSTDGLKFALYTWTVDDREDPRLLFFEIPSREIQTLKELCRYSILNLVIDDLKVLELPLPSNLITYLTSASPCFRYSCAEKQGGNASEKKGKSCNLM